MQELILNPEPEKGIEWYVCADFAGGWNQEEVNVARNDIFILKWKYYGPKRDIWDYWETLAFCLLFYYIL